MTVERDSELARVRAENEALNEQVQLLVQTEQRLYRSQHELDSQLVRIRGLARFSLESGGAESPSHILERALELVAKSFALDWVGVVALDGVARSAHVVSALDVPRDGEGVLAIEAPAFDWLASIDRPCLLTEPDRGDGDSILLRFARAVLPAALRPGCGPGCQVACAPLRRTDGRRPGVIVVYNAQPRRAWMHGGGLGEAHLPFLELLALHTEHAIETALLNESLRERSAQLATSLEALESTQAALLQSQKMEAIGQLAGGVAHDFNNLLTVILGYASTLALSLPRDSPHFDNARRIVDAARRASGITGQLLALGRRQVQTPEALDLAAQAQRLAELLRRLVGDHIEIVLDLDRALPPVRADRSQLEQILLNLVVNARDAMPNGGRMRIVTRPARPEDAARCATSIDPAGFGVVEVHDGGIGMDEATRSRIFEPFFTTKSAGEGTGLGLSVVYGIVRQSGGQVLVASTPGAGSAFTVLLPFADEAVIAESGGRSADPAIVEEPPRVDAGPSARILVAEDEPGIRGVVAASLKRAGFQVELASDGAQALSTLRAAKALPDLLLTDVAMPRMSGFQLALEAHEQFPSLRIAFMSGYFGDRAGAAVPGPFLVKPFAPDDLVRFVRAQLLPAAALEPPASAAS